ncbi:MAG: YbaL family putative K(+) efflux transporter [Parvibaculum sp.]|uniref:YbaL family putative K(+) efflux transporter n=1 Tax=Parvibaculum sp. TaxID=2024848 RepID=UPI003C72A22C
MLHHTPLITTIVGGLVLAFIFGAIANRFRVSPLVGYLLAGVLAGPFTPGFVADRALAPELAEIGVILLMFGVGLHFSLKDLLSVKAIAIRGALAQIAAATLLGMALSWALGWPVGSGLVFGLALSTASTVVLLRAMQERRLVDTERGRIAIGWLIVEDLAMVLTLVLLPALAGLLHAAGSGAEGTAVDAWGVTRTLLVTLGKVAAFVALMLVVGRKVIPWLLHFIAHSGSRELFRLAVLVIALGVAYGAAVLFGVSFALGAFFAGMVLSESPLSQRAAEESLPLRDAFAVLFFVSVGMLFDPKTLLNEPLTVLATLLIIVLGKSAVAFFIVRAFGHPNSTALTISASLAQIGEFSFILATLGVSLELLPARGRDLILAGALLSIVANPLFFMALDRLKPWLEKLGYPDLADRLEVKIEEEIPPTSLRDHAVVIGFGEVGSLIGKKLQQAGMPVLVIETAEDIAAKLGQQDYAVIKGNAASASVIAAANLPAARWLFVAISNAFEAGQAVQQARKLSPSLEIIARAYSDAEIDYLRQHGANLIIMGEREIARGMIEHALGNGASNDMKGAVIAPHTA